MPAGGIRYRAAERGADGRAKTTAKLSNANAFPRLSGEEGVDQLEVILVPEQDDRVNPAGIKGLGELGNVDTAAAIANAVYHATGQRVRDLPIKLDKLLL